MWVCGKTNSHNIIFYNITQGPLCGILGHILKSFILNGLPTIAWAAVGLTILACLSPLLTYARLWQMKEWRLDRLREHIKEEGVWATFWSMARVGIAVLGILSSGFLNPVWAIIGALAAMTVLQVLLRKQNAPVWTAKARMIVGLSLLIDTVTAWSLINFQFSIVNDQFIPVLPYLQPLVVTLAWILLFPIDRFLKQRIMDRARRLRERHSDLVVIGITGSVGKTTTKELIAHILAEQKPLVTPEHVNTEMGVSQWLIDKLAIGPSSELRAGNWQLAVMEMGAYRRGEIALLCEIAQPQIGVLTHIGSQHVGLFGSLEDLRDAKAELLECLPQTGRAFINGDCSPCREVVQNARCPVTLVGTGGHLDLEAFDIEETAEGMCFRAENTVYTVALHGTHNVTNVLLAIAVARHLGIDAPAIAARLKTFVAPSKTFRMRHERGVTILDDTHNASEASMEAAIAWARAQPERHKVLVTPGLIELGEMEERVHEKLGSLAREVFDAVLFTNKKSVQQFARGYGKNVQLLSKNTRRVEPGTLLVCVGRMGASTIERLLPG